MTKPESQPQASASASASESQNPPANSPPDHAASAESASTRDNTESGASAEDRAATDVESTSAQTATELHKTIEELTAERDQFKDRWMRTEAELDNYRKRARKDADEARKYASLPLVRDLLPGVDNLRRAIEAAAKSSNVDELTKGVEMVARQFHEVFERYGVKPIAAVGETFDPNLHEAVQQLPSAEHPPMTVTADYEPGYTLHDRVIRPSKVVVSSGPAESSSSS